MSTLRVVIEFDWFPLPGQRNEEFVRVLDWGCKLHQHGSFYPVCIERAGIVEPIVESRTIRWSPDLALCSMYRSKTVVFVVLSVAIERAVCQGRCDKTIGRMGYRKAGQPARTTESSDPDLPLIHESLIR